MLLLSVDESLIRSPEDPHLIQVCMDQGESGHFNLFLKTFVTTRIDLEAIMQSEISQTKTNCIISHVEAKKSQLIKQRVEWCLPGIGGEGTGEMCFKGKHLQLVRR